MAKLHFEELSKGLSKLRQEQYLLDATISTNKGNVELHKLILCLFSETLEKKLSEDKPFTTEALGYSAEDVENIVQFLYDGDTVLKPKCTEIINSLHLDLSVDQKIRHKKVSKSKGENIQDLINLELNCLRNSIFEMRIPRLLAEPRQLSDIGIRTGTIVHKCHKLILSAVSEYFTAMFGSGMKESSDEIVVLEGVDSKVFSSILSYIYFGKCELNFSISQDILSTAVYLQISTLQLQCEEFLLQNIDVTNCVDLWKLGVHFSCDLLKDGAWQFLVDNFKHINQLKLISELNIHNIKNLVKNENLDVEDENSVFQFVLQWAKHNKGLEDLHQILSLVRLTLIDLALLESSLKDSQIIKTNKACMDMLKTAVEKKINNEENGIELEYPRKETCFIVLKRSSYISGIEAACFSLRHKKWFELTPLTSSAGGSAFAAVATDLHIYMSGGSQTPKCFYQYSVEDDSWSELARMNHPRWAHVMGCVHGNVFVLGGSDNTFDTRTGALNALQSIEKYESGAKEWETLVETLRIATYDAAYATVNTSLYILGGAVSTKVGAYLKDIQCFNTVTETCTVLYYPLPFTLSLGIACTHNKDIYVVNPNGKFIHFNETLGPPTIIFETNGVHLMAFATVFHNKNIYIMGGFDMVGETDVIHKYDIKNKRISTSKDLRLPFERKSNHLFGAVMRVSPRLLTRDLKRNIDQCQGKKQRPGFLSPRSKLI
ncbi:kelch-like protein 24 [Mya arenaria]|uniref:kelch-like protein 24 n=1 Tax=Mya arenaria TaxID=6604 RepID=UPI0022E26E08|nr:kelch-like protein 24 [Mya arenaria]